MRSSCREGCHEPARAAKLTMPSELQNYTQFAPGIVTGSNQTDPARALVTFLSSPAAQTVLKAKGFG